MFEDDVFPANSSVLTNEFSAESYVIRPFGQQKSDEIQWMRPHVSLKIFGTECLLYFAAATEVEDI